MPFKLDPITGQIIRSKNEEAKLTEKSWNPKDYFNYTDNAEVQPPKPAQIADVLPKERQPQSVNDSPYNYSKLSQLLKAKSGSTVNDQELKRQQAEVAGRVFDDEQSRQLDELDKKMSQYEGDTPEYNHLSNLYDELDRKFMEENKRKLGNK